MRLKTIKTYIFHLYIEMPRKTRATKKFVCPNLKCGCSNPYWAYEGPWKKHVAKCNVIIGRPEPNVDMWSLVKSLKKRIDQLEEDRAVMQQEIRSLKQAATEPGYTRGPYNVRSDTVGIPAPGTGWGRLNHDAFVNGLRLYVEYYKT